MERLKFFKRHRGCLRSNLLSRLHRLQLLLQLLPRAFNDRRVWLGLDNHRPRRQLLKHHLVRGN
jgi:hypothetical protein